MDHIDQQIIRIIKKNARITMSELGRQIAMSSTSTKERVRRLEEKGIILGYETVIDEKKAGNPIHAYLLVESSQEMRRWPERFNEQVRKMPEIVAAFYALTGGIDYIMEVYCTDLERLSQIQKQVFTNFNVNTITYMVNQNIIEFPQPEKREE